MPTEGYGGLDQTGESSASVPATRRAHQARLVAAAALAAALGPDEARTEALLDASEAMACDTEDAAAVALSALARSDLAFYRGDYDRIPADLTAALAVWRQLAEPGWRWEALGRLGHVALIRGEWERAEALMSEGLAEARASGWRPTIAAALEFLGTCARMRGDQRQAAARFVEALTIVRDGADPGVIANCLKSVGEVAAAVGRDEEAARLLGASEAQWERLRLGMLQWAGEGEWIEGAMAPARAKLPGAGFAAAQHAGHALPIELAIAEALALAGEVAAVPSQPAVAPPLSRSGLTPREEDVLRLLADGRSNREIADTLNLSERTVENHVLHILTKLDLPSRAAAAAYAVRHGLA